MGERLLCKQEVIGSIPFTSTILKSECGKQRTVRRRNRFADRKICGLFDIVKNSFREHTSIWLNAFAKVSAIAKG